MRKTVAILLALLAMPSFALAIEGADYKTPWHDPDMAVTSTLTKNGARGCGEYYYLDHKTSQHEKLVYCTPDGKAWNVYIVWPNINRMTGPHEPLQDVPPPKR